MARNAPWHAAQLAPLRAFGLTAARVDTPGELAIAREGRKQRLAFQLIPVR